MNGTVLATPQHLTASESKYRHDEAFDFRVLIRRARLFGQWVGERIGRTEEEALALGEEMAALYLDHPEIETLLLRAEMACEAAHRFIPHHVLFTHLESLRSVAQDQMMRECELVAL